MRQYKAWAFPAGAALVYVLLFFLDQEKTMTSIQAGERVLLQIALPLSIAFIMMILLNRFLPPSTAVKYLGKDSGLRGMLFSSLAGMVSMGPIYSWYPLLSSMKEKGASTFHVANFMAFRSIKPVLIPIVFGYFGGYFTTVFLLATMIGSLLTAWVVAKLNG